MTGRLGGIVADLDDIAVARIDVGRLLDAVADCRSCGRGALEALPGVALHHPFRAAELAVELLDLIDGPLGLRFVTMELGTLGDVAALAVAAYRGADDALDAAQWELVSHPRAVGAVVHGAERITGQNLQQLSRDLTPGWVDGRPRISVESRGPTAPPRSVADLMTALRRRSDLADRQRGGFSVTQVTGAAGTAWIVDLPGTSSWDLPLRPARDEPDVADLGGDLRLMAGESTAYGRGVTEALGTLPIRPGQPVLITGHSEGGMLAVALSRSLPVTRYDVTGLLTCGSPIAGMQPRGSLLALENTDDIVPELDGAPNPSRPGWATLRFSDQRGTVDGDHGFTAYGEGARLADVSTRPDVVAWRRAVAPFLDGSAATTWSWRIGRAP